MKNCTWCTKGALSNTLKADNSGGTSSSAAQHIDKSESSLTVQLLFDSSVPGSASVPKTSGQNEAEPNLTSSTTNGASAANHKANSDVRLLTQRIAETFMKPVEGGSGKPGAPKRCRFQWGTFVFVGMVSSYNETLDFFTPEGVPLRATLALTLKEDRYQFTLGNNPITGDRAAPKFAKGNSNKPVSSATDSGKKPDQWRDTALYNGIENPRETPRSGVSIPSGSVTGGSGGFQAGRSDSLGTGIPGAFWQKGGANG
ncbi:MAG: hypothetical protein P8X74_17400 [Reinekea sp.]